MPLVRGEAVEQSVAERRAQRGLRAAARRMGSIPGIAAAPAAAVVMPHHRPALAMARPPAARRVATRHQGAIGVTASKDVVPGGGDVLAFLGERCIPGEIDVLAVKFVNAGRDLDSLRVDPRPSTDPVSRVDRRCIG